MKGEFGFIARHFRPLAGPGAYDLRNDGAVLSHGPGEEFAVSTDTMVENVHFLSDDPPETLGRKLLRCNLSDLAAMGATPYAYTLNVAIPQGRQYVQDWFAAFSAGLTQDQKSYGIFLLGGDTTSTQGPLVLSATVYGRLRKGTALYRHTALPGDEVWVTGTIGDAALGLKALKGALPDHNGFLAGRYRLPQPRTGLGLHGIVNAAMDVSDGLVQDCGHIASESRVALRIEATQVPRSPAACALGEKNLMLCLTGGDDYELLLTCPAANTPRLVAECEAAKIAITRIGHVMVGSGVTVVDAWGHDITPQNPGWQHF